jgi:hypothetical protein
MLMADALSMLGSRQWQSYPAIGKLASVANERLS